MNRIYFCVLRDSPLESPFSPRLKPVAPALIAAIPAVAQVVSSMIMGSENSASQSATNQWNYRIAQENRIAQIAENEKNRLFSREMWNLENEYNSPANQRRLNEEAGYNPYLLGSGNAGQGAGTPISPSSSPLPSTPQMVSSRPGDAFSGFGDAFAKLVQLSQSGEQIQSNVATQRAQAISMINETLLNTLKDAGPDAVNKLAKSLAPILDGLDWKNTPSYQLFVQELKKYQVQNEWQDLQNQVFSIYGKDTAKVTLDNLHKTYEVMDAQIKSLESQSNLNKSYADRTASEIARNFAEAFKARKEGDYYYVSADQLGIINKMLDMQEQDLEADFAYNTSVRKYKKEIPHRSDRLGLLLGSLGAQNTQLEIQGNKKLQYGKEVLDGVGKLFKVNFGVSNNRSTYNSNRGSSFHNDGYSMENGVLWNSTW